VAVITIDLILVIYVLVIGCTELMNTKEVMNMKAYRGYWKISTYFLDRFAVIVPILLMIELIGIIFMGQACSILYTQIHGYVIAYIVTYIF